MQQVIHRLLTGDDVAAAELIPLADTRRKLLRDEMNRSSMQVLSRRFQLVDGFIDIHMTQVTVQIHIHVEEGGGFNYDFVASDHVTNRGSVPYDNNIYNGSIGEVVEVDGLYFLVVPGANTVLQAHGVEVEFTTYQEKESYQFPLLDPTTAPKAGKKFRARKVKAKCSSTGLGGSPTTADPEKYPLGNANLLTRMPYPNMWNVQAAPQYKWYTEKGVVISGLKVSGANSMSWTSDTLGNFTSRKHADPSIDIGSDIDTQSYKGKNKTTTRETNLDEQMAHSCVRVVDGVELFLVTDVKGDLYVYKTSDPAEAPVYVKVQPPYPSWVSAYSYNARWTWDFNSTGTKMIAVPYNSDKGAEPRLALDDYEWIKEDGGSCEPALGSPPPEFYTIEDIEFFNHPFYLDNGHNAFMRKNIPGFVEFNIEILIVDGEINQVILTLEDEDTFAVSGKYYIGAAYEYNTDMRVFQTIEAKTDVALVHSNDPENKSYMDTFYYAADDPLEENHFLEWNYHGDYSDLPKIDVVWNLWRDVEPTPVNPDPDPEIVSHETLLRDFPLARYSQIFTGMPGSYSCSDRFAGKMYEIAFLAGKNGIAEIFFKYAQGIDACCMKSMTYVVRSYDFSTKGWRIISNGHELKAGGITAAGVDVDYNTVDMSNVISNTVPVTHPEILGYWGNMNVKQDFFNYIDTHPSGHMAMCIPDYYQVDAPIEAWWDAIAGVPVEPPNQMIDYIRLSNGSEGTHKELFNKAFKTSRDYQYYYDPMNLGGYLGETTHEDRGSFAITGIWRTS